jgi:hypothetical protein
MLSCTLAISTPLTLIIADIDAIIFAIIAITPLLPLTLRHTLRH